MILAVHFLLTLHINHPYSSLLPTLIKEPALPLALFGFISATTREVKNPFFSKEPIEDKKELSKERNMGTDHVSDYDWEKEVEDFQKTKAGVKGLVDSGIQKIPRFFISPPESLLSRTDDSGELQLQIPVIDFEGVEKGGARRRMIVDEIRKASESWGFFQMVNHGVPLSVLKAILESTRRFHEQPTEAKMELYSSDSRRKVRFYDINGHFRKSDVAGWRDAFSCTCEDDILEPEAIPSVCRSEVIEYLKYMIKLRDLLSELFSEALGLRKDFLNQIQCMKSEYLTCLYYPACPEPNRTFGTVKHSDPTVLTIVVQDLIGGLQIHRENNWIDVPPIEGAFIANIGDLLQLMTNDKFKSVEHRVLARSVGTRVSAACFFFPSSQQMLKDYGPIKELISKENPPLYREVCYLDFVTTQYQKNVRDGSQALSSFKL